MEGIDERKVLNVHFNQNCELFAACLEGGLRIYNLDPLVEKIYYDIKDVGGIEKCEMLYRSNILALVSGGKAAKYPNNILHLYDDLKRKKLCEIKFESGIKNVRLRRDRIFVVLLTKIHVFDLQRCKLLYSLESRQNRLGLCEISALDSKDPLIVFPARKVGHVQVIRIPATLDQPNDTSIMINAHRSELACLALNKDGNMLATASVQGTLIRVWCLMTRNQLIEVRRGADTATVQCINFSRESDYMCCSSDKGTVHIFALKDSNLNKRISIPSVALISKYADSQWGLTNFTITPQSTCICGFGPKNSVYAICLDGTIHKYVFNNEGACHRQQFAVYLDAADEDEF